MIVTKMSRAVMPSMDNGNGILFGGKLLSWMDEIAGIAAVRYDGGKVVTVAMEQAAFRIPIPVGKYIDIVGEVVSVGNTSLRVRIRVLIDGQEDIAAEAVFIFVAVDEEGRPRKVNDEK
ncbi:MAG: acyl-CoA thioesterase [Paenibacillaceae bacterium]|nr:acyl-CoA thioesterase [Paenibacillaceae bacterium]